VWEKWSKDNPQLAKIFWPSVQKLAIHRAYFAIPELLQFAATCPTVIELQLAIDKISQLAASDQVARLVAKHDFSEARITLEWGKTFGSSPAFDRLEMLIRQGFISLAEPKKIAAPKKQDASKE